MRASLFVTLGIGGLAVIVASGFVLAYSIAVERTGGNRVHARMGARAAVLAWMAMFAALAESGKLLRFDVRPPPLLLAMVSFLVSGVGLAMSRIGTTFARALPISWLVAAQSFRLPLEIVMHQAAREGVMPVEMSFSGYNFDIVTGITALVVGYLEHRGRSSDALVFAWNVLGSVLLTIIVSIAVLASPMVRAFGDEPEHVNTFIGRFPFIWLGTVLVASAAFGHVVIFRALKMRKSARKQGSTVGAQTL